MTVVEGYYAGVKYDSVPALEDLPEAARAEIVANAALNSKVRGCCSGTAVCGTAVVVLR